MSIDTSKRSFLEIGSKYGRWTVMRLMKLISYEPTRYQCQCECGKLYVLAANTLKAGLSKQCRFCASVRWRKLCFKCKAEIEDKHE